MSKYEIILYWSEEDSAFIAEVPELAGCMADGISMAEALHNAEIVIAEHDFLSLVGLGLRHDSENGVHGEIILFADLFHPLCLRNGGRCLFTVDGFDQQALLRFGKTGDLVGWRQGDLALVHHLHQLRDKVVE